MIVLATDETKTRICKINFKMDSEVKFRAEFERRGLSIILKDLFFLGPRSMLNWLASAASTAAAAAGDATRLILSGSKPSLTSAPFRLFERQKTRGQVSISSNHSLKWWCFWFSHTQSQRFWTFYSPNHDYCIAETGYLADKAGPTAPIRYWVPDWQVELNCTAYEKILYFGKV